MGDGDKEVMTSLTRTGKGTVTVLDGQKSPPTALAAYVHVVMLRIRWLRETNPLWASSLPALAVRLHLTAISFGRIDAAQ